MTRTSLVVAAVGMLTGANGAAQSRPADSTTAAKLWVNYDFVPGDRVLFYTDYAEDVVGNFPKRLTFKSGSMELVEVNEARWLRITGTSLLNIPLPEVLPAKFTIEIDVINPQVLAGAAFRLQGGPAWNNTGKTSTVTWGSDGIGLSAWSGGAEVALTSNEANRARYRGKASQLRILGDGPYLKIYLDEKRYANVPNANFERSKSLTLGMEGRGEDRPVYVGRIRIAASDKTIYDALAATGRVATQGILFDTGSERIKPESAPTLKEIATLLEEHAELRLRIEGHTDNVGAKPSNLTLSGQRAAAVREVLVREYKVDGTRLESAGLGDTKPAAPNTTSEGRQTNRRVELVRL